jgi:hypothetical protein
MVALLMIALCWAFRTGKWLTQSQTITIKNHDRKSKSIFPPPNVIGSFGNLATFGVQVKLKF